MAAIKKTQQQFFSIRKFEGISKNYELRYENFTSESHRFKLLSKLTFNIFKGHYNFVYELLKSKLDEQKRFIINFNPNEQTTISKNKLVKNWLQLESISNQKFLNGKTPLILCNYTEDKWAVTLTRMLIENGADITKQDLTNGCQTFHYACSRLNGNLIEILLRNVDFDLSEAVDFNGNTPLVYFLISYCYNHSRLSNEKRSIIVRSLIEYLNHLKNSGLIVNTVNNLGYSVSDFYFMITSSDLKNSEFYKVLRNEMGASKNQNFTNQESILKKNLLIDLNEFKYPRSNIVHCASLDSDMIFMFLNRDPSNQSYDNDQIMKSFWESTKYLYDYNESSKLQEARSAWRTDLKKIFENLEVKNSASYRKKAIQVTSQPDLNHSIKSAGNVTPLNKSSASGTLKSELLKINSSKKEFVNSHKRMQT